jgi:hypothetical protein
MKYIILRAYLAPELLDAHDAPSARETFGALVPCAAAEYANIETFLRHFRAELVAAIARPVSARAIERPALATTSAAFAPPAPIKLVGEGPVDRSAGAGRSRRGGNRGTCGSNAGVTKISHLARCLAPLVGASGCGSADDEHVITSFVHSSDNVDLYYACMYC